MPVRPVKSVSPASFAAFCRSALPCRGGHALRFERGAWQRMLLILAGLLLGSGAQAIGLGTLTVSSGLSQPFRGVIPIIVNQDEEAGCAVLRPNDADDLPGLRDARLSVVEAGGMTRLEISSFAPVTEPVLKLSIRLGCSSQVTRSFMVLLDPPVLFGGDAAPQLTVPSVTPEQPAVAAQLPTAQVAPAVPTAPVAGRGVTSGQRATAAAPVARSRNVARNQSKRAAPVAAAKPAGDQLRLEGAAKATQSTPPVAEQLRVESDRLRRELEGANQSINKSSHEIELQRKVLELMRQSDKLNLDLKTMNEALRVAKEAPAQRDWLSWLLAGAAVLLVVAVLAGLALALLWWRRRRAEPEQEPEQPWWTDREGMAGDTGFAQFGGPITRMLDDSPAEGKAGSKSPMVVEETSTKEALDHFRAPAANGGQATPAAPDPDEQHKATLDFLLPATLSDTPATLQPTEVKTPKVKAQPEAALRPALAHEPPSPIHTEKTHQGAAPIAPITAHLELPVLVVPAEQAPAQHRAAPVNAPVNAPAAKPAPEAESMNIEFGPIDFAVAGSEPPAPPILFDEVIPDDAGTVPAAVAAHTGTQERLAQFAAVTAQVDALIGSGDAARAVALLRRYVLRDENIPTLMWLQLLDLYQRTDKRPVYDAVADHFTRRYARPVMAWDQTPADRAAQKHLSECPEIGDALRADRGTSAGLDMLNALLCGKDQPDAVVFNAVLQRELLDLVKSYPA